MDALFAKEMQDAHDRIIQIRSRAHCESRDETSDEICEILRLERRLATWRKESTRSARHERFLRAMSSNPF